MTSNIFSIAAATSDLAERFNEAVEKNEKARTADQLNKLHEKMELIQRLSSRGLLNRQDFQAEPSSETFEKIYSSNIA